jgi:NADPH-dependent curcumin reductase CurA
MAAPTKSRSWILKARPAVGPFVAEQTLELVEAPLPALKDGEVLVKNICFSIDPTQRIWMVSRAR